MGIDLEVLSTRRSVVTPQEFADEWGRVYQSPAPEFRRLSGGDRQPDGLPFILDAHYAVRFADDGNGPGFDVSRNLPDEMDERTYLEDFGDASDLAGVVDLWREAGHTYGFTLNGAYGAADVHRMIQAARITARLVGGMLIALDPLPFDMLPRGIHDPDLTAAGRIAAGGQAPLSRLV